ncbi:putative metal-binding motif-containing protein, partial [Candidatus Woesearchaeota archaeon]|nr:putative metal-binding motif-containing protein [Candidatus Woesearchaeota archaeon]
MRLKQAVLCIVFLLFVAFSTTALGLECSVAQKCSPPGETLVLCLSDRTNAHAELPQTVGGIARCQNEGYDWKLCCRGGVDTTCKEDNQILWLASATNSHASQKGDQSYSIPVCINGLRGTKCSSSSFSGSACVLSLSDKTNAHLASCAEENSYGIKVYCSINSDSDGDGFTADVDCDDDRDIVHPDTAEIGDGIDNDCDGLIDGDDSDFFVLPRGWYQVSKDVDDEKFGSYTSAGIEVIQRETGENVFVVTGSGKKGILSKGVNVEKNKEYVARVTTTCEATLQLAFDNAAGEEEGGFLGFFQDLTHSVTGKGALSIVANSQDAERASLFISVNEKDCQISNPQLDLKGKVQPVEYNDAVHPVALPVNPTTTFPAAACCPQNFCWNGFSCVENMREQTFVSEKVTEKAVYQCIDGYWVFRAKLFDWDNQESGSCPQEGQCFVLSSQKDGSAQATAHDFYQGKYPLCVNNGDSIFDHYCQEGVWLTRTQLVAEQLLKSVSNEDFTLYCTNPQDALVSMDNQEQILLGDISNVASSGSSEGLLATAKPAPTRVCFPDLGVSGKKLIDDVENTCINNVCLLQDSNGDIALATTLNRDVSDVATSFVQALGISPEAFLQSCSGDGEFKTCIIDGIAGEIYYSSSLNALIYSREGLSFEPSLLDNIISFFKGIFGGTVDEPSTLVPADKAVPQIYLLRQGDKAVRAVVEDHGKDQFGNDNQTLSANYTGFETPLCLFVEHLSTPVSAGKGVLGALAGESGFVCIAKDGTQEIIATKDVGYLWPQLTGRLRVE